MKTSQQEIIKEEVAQKPALPINEKGFTNKYTKEHLEKKNIPIDFIKRCLSEGKEVTSELKAERRYTLKGHRYFKLEMPNLDKKYIPGKITLPDPRGELAGEVVNWNFSPFYMIRGGRVVPTILENDIPNWLAKETSALYVIVAENQLPNGVILEKDGPTNNDIGGSWFVITAHFGPPSRPKPKIPDLDKSEIGKEAAQKLKNYFEQLDAWKKEQERTYYIINEEGYKKLKLSHPREFGKKQFSSAEELLSEIQMLREKNQNQQETIDELIKEIEIMHREINKLSSAVKKGEE